MNENPIMKQNGKSKIPPKKSLGQNFLTSEAAIYKIVKAAKILPGETALEIGPGRGALTKALLAADAKVVAVEKDRALIGELSAKFAEEIKTGRLKIIWNDILKIEPEEIGLKKRGLTESSRENSKESRKNGAGDGAGEDVGNSTGEDTRDGLNNGYKIVANIPYYITGHFLKKFLSTAYQPTTMVLLLQKEVVDRIIAANGKESIMSIGVKAYGEPKKIASVNRGSFFPAPNVDSTVIVIENISKRFFGAVSEENFFRVVKAGFAHKRKILASNLSVVAGRAKIAEVFKDCAIPEKTRAEDLTVKRWKDIAEKIF